MEQYIAKKIINADEQKEALQYIRFISNKLDENGIDASNTLHCVIPTVVEITNNVSELKETLDIVLKLFLITKDKEIMQYKIPKSVHYIGGYKYLSRDTQLRYCSEAVDFHTVQKALEIKRSSGEFDASFIKGEYYYESADPYDGFAYDSEDDYVLEIYQKPKYLISIPNKKVHKITSKVTKLMQFLKRLGKE